MNRRVEQRAAAWSAPISTGSRRIARKARIIAARRNANTAAGRSCWERLLRRRELPGMPDKGPEAVVHRPGSAGQVREMAIGKRELAVSFCGCGVLDGIAIERSDKPGAVGAGAAMDQQGLRRVAQDRQD